MDKNQALDKARRLCASREQAELQIRMKLSAWGLPTSESDHILEVLKSERYLDNERFAKAYVNDKFRFNKWGKLKIAMHLRALHISEETIFLALGSISHDDYREFVFRELRNKMRTIKESDQWQNKAKLYRYGQSKGMEPDIVHDVLNHLLATN